MPCENQKKLIALFPELQPVLDAVTKLNRDNGRYAFQDYLTEVYRVGWHWSRLKIRKRRTKGLANLAETDTRDNAHAFRVIIEATYPSLKAKMASRWTRALELALSERVPVPELTKYFKTSGGVATCARRAALAIPKREMYRQNWD
jgi:hypothetical protein